MKNSLKYFGLWQKKRSELRINDDPQTDWQHMQGLLDQHLPVEAGKPSRSKGFKLMSVLFVSMSAAAMTYIVSNIVEIKKHKHGHTFSYHHKNKIISSIDSISNNTIPDSLTHNSTTETKDSLSTVNSSADLQNERQSNPGAAKSSGIASAKSAANASASTPSGAGTIPGKSSGAVAKRNNLSVANRASGSLRTISYTSGKPFRSSNKNNVLKHGSSQRNGGRYGNVHGIINSGPIVAGNLNGHANHFEVNGTNKQVNGADKITGKIDSSHTPQYPALLSLAPMVGFGRNSNAIYPVPITASTISIARKSITDGRQPGSKAGKAGKSPKIKNTANKNSTQSNIDWGLLTGVNSSGSFTPKSQNSNFYGSSPIDLYFGLYGTYHLNDKWGINTQVRLFSPQTITTTYGHANGSKVDSGQLIQIVNSGKFYSVSVPLRTIYRVNSNISFVGGPVFNVPVKTINVHSSLLPAGIKADTAYYAKTINLLKGATYLQSFNLGVTGGVNFQVKRLSFEASWLRSLSGYQVTSGFGSGRSYNNTFQFTIGFQLSKVKP
jgi:hypothetical protein